MKTHKNRSTRRFQLELSSYGSGVELVAKLEAALQKKPRRLQLDLVGVGEISPDAALRIRAALRVRAPKITVITNACSSLQNGAVLVWLLGDERRIRDDATIYFRRANLGMLQFAEVDGNWNEEQAYCDSYSAPEPEEGDYARVLQHIDEFLPVRELVGKLVGASVLRQFGLIENERVDEFLATTFARAQKRIQKRSIRSTRRGKTRRVERLAKRRVNR
jgi:hypothetical protein